MDFKLLLDYDNIEKTDRDRGVIYIIERILIKFSKIEITERNLTVRIYGGWYENDVFTRRGQDLNTEIRRDFPRPVTLSDGTSSVIVNVELALSLAILPQTSLFNTFRRRGFPNGLSSISASSLGCVELDCPVEKVHLFLRAGHCNNCTNVKPEDIFYKQEQKLVDTMITSDMISIGSYDRKFCILSSDDDFWPGILTAINGGATVYHMHTKGRVTPRRYSNTVTFNYFQKTF